MESGFMSLGMFLRAVFCLSLRMGCMVSVRPLTRVVIRRPFPYASVLLKVLSLHVSFFSCFYHLEKSIMSVIKELQTAKHFLISIFMMKDKDFKNWVRTKVRNRTQYTLSSGSGTLLAT